MGVRKMNLTKKEKELLKLAREHNLNPITARQVYAQNSLIPQKLERLTNTLKLLKITLTGFELTELGEKELI